MSAIESDEHPVPVDDSVDDADQDLLAMVSDRVFVDPVDAAAGPGREWGEPEAAWISQSRGATATQGAAAAVGPLGDAEPDTMTLHTRDAYLMFTGRKHEPGSPFMPIVGGRKLAAVLKSIWYLSAQDNPYADWILIQLHDGLADLRSGLARATRQREGMLAQIARKGLALSVMSSRRPAIVALGFRSPYGYATAQMIVEFDYCVRVIKTLVQKDCLSDVQGQNAIRALTREMRRFFLGAVRWERLLLREDVAALSRGDFLPGADAVAQKRTETAITLFGRVPQKILLGHTVPRHTRRRAKPTKEELRALRQAASAGDDARLPGEALL